MRNKLAIIFSLILIPGVLLASGNDIIGPTLLELGTFILFCLFLLFIKIKLAAKVILFGVYCLTVATILYFIKNIPYSENKVIIDFSLEVFPVLIMMLILLIWRRTFKKS